MTQAIKMNPFLLEFPILAVSKKTPKIKTKIKGISLIDHKKSISEGSIL